MQTSVCLSDIEPGERALVLQLNGEAGLRRRLLDLGLAAGAEVQCLGRSPGGDPRAYLICGAVLALRQADCASILVRPL